MRHASKRALTGAAVATFTALSVLSASASEPADVAATETLYIAAGCPQDTPGTCTSTRWLGTTPGNATTNFVTAVTPVDEVLYRADGTVNWRDYVSDKSLRAEGYELRAGDTLTMAVRVSATGGVAANATVHGAVEGVTAAKKLVRFGEAEQVVTVVAGTRTVTFGFEVPAALDGVVMKGFTALVAVHGVNVQGGHIDQQGGSTLTVPHRVPAAG